MGKITAAMMLETKRFFCLRNYLILLILLALIIYCVQEGKSDYKVVVGRKAEFQKNEAKSSSRINNYITYSFIGINVIFVSSPATVLMANPSKMAAVNGKVNSIMTLDIYNTIKGPLITDSDLPFQPKVSNVFYLLGVLLCLIFGYDGYRNKEYLKMHASVSSPWIVYSSIFIVRMIIIVIFFLLTLAISLFLMKMDGIPIQAIELTGMLAYIAVSLTMFLFFFLLGTIIAAIPSEKLALTTIIAIWLTFILILPYINHSIIKKKSKEFKSSFELQTQMLEIMKDMEDRLIKEGNNPKDNTREENQKLSEEYLIKEFLELQALEEEYRKKIEEQITFFNGLSILTPTSFYILTTYEASSRGYSSCLDFYAYLQKLRYLFTRWWIDRVDYDLSTVVKIFVKKDENVFMAKSHVPANFNTGLQLNLGYCLLLLPLSYFCYLLSVFRISKTQRAELGKVSLNWTKKKAIVYYVTSDSFKNFLFTLFSNQHQRLKKAGIQGQVLYDGQNLLQDGNKSSFCYLPNPMDIPPDILVKNLLVYTTIGSKFSKEEMRDFLARPELAGITRKRFKALSKLEKFNALLAITYACKRGIYLIGDIAPVEHPEGLIRLQKRLEVLAQEALVIHLTTNPSYLFPYIDYSMVYQECSQQWEYKIMMISERHHAKEIMNGAKQ